MALKLRPLADRLVVEPIEREETFAGGALVLPETAKEKPQQGRVSGCRPRPPGRQRQAHSAGSESGRHRALCQVFGHGNQGREQESSDSQRDRHSGCC